MGRRSLLVCVLAWLPAVVASVGMAADDSNMLGEPPVGSLARQRWLMLRLEAISEGSLQVSLSHNRKEWEQLPPDQRDQYRRQFLAFLRESPKEQERLLKNCEKLFRLSAEKRVAYQRRANWLKVVMGTFTAKQRGELERLGLDQRAQRIVQRKGQLVAEGRLKPDEPKRIPDGKGAKGEGSHTETTSAAAQPAK